MLHLTLVLCALLSADFSWAQYNVGSGPTAPPTLPKREIFDQAIAAAPWRFGGLHLQPWVGLRDGSLVTNQEVEGSTTDDDTDFTITVGAGLRGYLGHGKNIVTAHVLPEYVWWNDATERRRLNGRYGIGYFGFFNRLKVELSSRVSEQQGFFSEEIRQLATTRQTANHLVAEWALSRRLGLYGSFSSDEITGKEEERPVFSLFDRQTTTYSLGLRYEAPEGLRAELGVQQGEEDFAENALEYSNEFETVRIGVGYRGNKFESKVDLVLLELTPDLGSTLEVYDEKTGEAEIRWLPSRLLEVGAFAHREFRYALVGAYTSERQGLEFQLKTRVANLGIWASVGEDRYTELDRQDDVTELEAMLDFEVGRLLLVTVSANYIDYESNVLAASRDITRLGVAIHLGELASRLRIGSDRGAW